MQQHQRNEIVVEELGEPLLDFQYDDVDNISGINSQSISREDDVGCWWRLTFGWVGQLMKVGNKRALQQEDLLSVPEFIQPQNSQRRINSGWDKEVKRSISKRRPASLFRMMVASYGLRFASIGILKLLNDILNFAAPLLLNALLGYLSDKPFPLSEPVNGFVWAVLLGISALLKALLNSQYDYFMGLLSCEVSSGISCKIYEHSLHMKNVDMRGFTLGQIQTFMSIDANRLVNIFSSGHELWSLPLQITAALILLYTQVQYAFVAGVGTVIVVSLLSFVVAKYISRASARLMRHKELRIGVIGELLKGIRTVKMLGWQPYFLKRIGKHRNDELQSLGTIKYLDALCVYFWVATQVLFAVFTFSLYVAMNNQLTVQVVFTSLALFNVLLGPLNSFPWVINGIIDSVISLHRLEAFLQMPERDPQDNFHDLDFTRQEKRQQTVIELAGAVLTWSPREGVSRMLTRALSQSMSADNVAFGEGSCAALRLIIPKLKILLGEKVSVVGRVGSGKSSLIAAILGEMNQIDGKRVLNGTVAYVGHNPWMMHATVRENILLGAPFDTQLYAKVILACALDLDLYQWPNKDLTNVGQGGSTLSGGQKVRVALARALYHKCTIYLLDDVLSSVDANVSHWLVNQALGDTFMNDKTLVMVTKSRLFIGRCDKVVHVNDGIVDKIQTPAEYLDELDKLVLEGDGEDDINPYLLETEDDTVSDMTLSNIHSQAPNIEKLSLTDWLRTRSPSFEMQSSIGMLEGRTRSHGSVPSLNNIISEPPHTPERSSDAASMESQGSFSMGGIKLARPVFPEEEVRTPQAMKQGGGDFVIGGSSRKSISARSDNNRKMSGSSKNSFERIRKNMTFVPLRSQSGGMDSSTGQQEEREIGHVKLPVYRFYISAVGCCLSAAILTSLLLMQISRNASDLWITYWATFPSYFKLSFYLEVFALIAVANSLFTLARAFLFAWGGIRSARSIHNRLLDSVVRASQYFFENTPSGRIINRFSSDSAIVDSDLPFQMNILLARIFQIAATLLILIFTQPLIVVGIVPLGIWYRYLQIYYRNSSRELRRLESLARSPVYSGFTELLSGLVTIRAFGLEESFIQDNCHHVLNLQQATYTNIVARQWLALRLQLICAVIVCLLAVLAVLEKDTHVLGMFERGVQGIGLVGLSITYVLPLVDQLNQLLGSSAQTEQEMVAVERIKQYSSLRPGYLRPPGWLQAQEWIKWEANGDQNQFGRVQFQAVWMKYAPNAAFVLKDISIDIAPASHVLVCGRTGAGKSSLLNALFRINPIQRGKILLDGVDTAVIPLPQFRSMVGIVPQTPFLFRGTVQENVDPLQLHTPEKVVWALQTVGLWNFIQQLAIHERSDRGDQVLGEGLDDEIVALTVNVGQQHHHQVDSDSSQVEVLIGSKGIKNSVLEVLNYHIDEQSLSQGQQQLLTLARVLLKRPRIVCLDEASASIDIQTAISIQNIIQRVLQGVTTLQISHDVENIDDCDHVVVLKEGQVGEQGTIESLVKKQGLFYRLRNVEGGSDDVNMT